MRIPIRYIDIHSHFNLNHFDGDLAESIAKIESEGVATICVGTDLVSSKRAIDIAMMSPNIWATVGLHPTDSDEVFDKDAFLELARHEKVVAIGECGYDYFHKAKNEPAGTTTIFEKQKELFEAQIKIADAVGKPLMIHARPSKGMGAEGRAPMDAYEDALELLVKYPHVRANFHFFVGNTDIAQRVLAGGHTMSFDGPITFVHDYDETLSSLPLSAIMAETDAPFAAPEPYRTTLKEIRGDSRPVRCEPWMVKEVVNKIAEIRTLASLKRGEQSQENEEIVRLAMLDNAKQFFKILL